MPTALICAARHMIRVASRFNGWVFADTKIKNTEHRRRESPPNMPQTNELTLSIISSISRADRSGLMGRLSS